MKKIPAGYRLIVTSWENDADNYNTKSVDGLSLEATKFLTDVIQLFYSRNNPPKGMVCFGNLYEPDDSEIAACYAAVQAVLDRHPAITDEALKDYFESPEGVMEYMYELGLTCGEFWTRVLEDFEVEHYPEDVIINDVTSQFKGNRHD